MKDAMHMPAINDDPRLSKAAPTADTMQAMPAAFTTDVAQSSPPAFKVDVAQPSSSVFKVDTTQPEVWTFLATALQTKNLSQAYLFVGGNPHVQSMMAHNLARALIASDCAEKDQACDNDLLMIDAGTHPDVRMYEPNSAQGYLSEQVANIIETAPLAPARALHKILILKRAHELTPKTANALLKTLEEPPANVLFILLAPTESAVLPTIVSRSQVVRFREETEAEQVRMLTENMQAITAKAQPVQDGCADAEKVRSSAEGTPTLHQPLSPDAALSALHITGSPQEAAIFLADPCVQKAKERLLTTVAKVGSFSTWQLLQEAKTITDSIATASKDSESPALDEKNDQAIQKEFLSSKAQKDVEKALKRADKAQSQKFYTYLLIMVELFLRDIVCGAYDVGGTRAALPDTLELLKIAIKSWSPQQALQGIKLVQEALSALEHNVAPRLALETMLSQMEDCICQK